MKRQERHKRHYATWILAALLVVAVVWVGYVGYKTWGAVGEMYLESQAIQLYSEIPCWGIKETFNRNACEKSAGLARELRSKIVFPKLSVGVYAFLPVRMRAHEETDSVTVEYRLFNNTEYAGSDGGAHLLGLRNLSDAPIALSSCKFQRYYVRSMGGVDAITCCAGFDCRAQFGISIADFGPGRGPDVLNEMLSVINASTQEYQSNYNQD